MRLGCVVLASGKGRRFTALGGAGNKLLAPVAGKPLICQTAASVPDDRFETVVSTRWPQVASAIESSCLPVRVVLHDLVDRSDSIRMGLGVGADRWDGCLFVSGDQPLVTRESYGALASAFESDPARAHRLSWDGVPGSPVLFPVSAFEALMALTGNRGGGSLLLDGSLPTALVPAACNRELWDVDTPEDLQRVNSALLP